MNLNRRDTKTDLQTDYFVGKIYAEKLKKKWKV